MFKFLVSGTHRFDVSMSVCVTPGYVLGLFFPILWLVDGFTGNPGQSWVLQVMKQLHEGMAYTSNPHLLREAFPGSACKWRFI